MIDKMKEYITKFYNDEFTVEEGIVAGEQVYKFYFSDGSCRPISKKEIDESSPEIINEILGSLQYCNSTKNYLKKSISDIEKLRVSHPDRYKEIVNSEKYLNLFRLVKEASKGEIMSKCIDKEEE